MQIIAIANQKGGVVKKLAAAKKGVYDGVAVVEAAPTSEIAVEYSAIADMIIADKYEREVESK